MADDSTNWGGKREGAGRRAVFELGEAKRKEIMKDIADIAKKKNTSIGKELGNMMFGRNKDKRLKMTAFQLYVKDVLPKISERETTTTTILKPQIYLPEELVETEETPDFKPH